MVHIMCSAQHFSPRASYLRRTQNFEVLKWWGLASANISRTLFKLPVPLIYPLSSSPSSIVVLVLRLRIRRLVVRRVVVIVGHVSRRLDAIAAVPRGAGHEVAGSAQEVRDVVAF